ncbi:MAG: energy transducer TonB [Candidatus Sulfotelmatobacter sp.]
MRQHRRNIHWTTLALSLFLAVFARAQADELRQHLRDQYQGKTRLLRGFYSGDHLLYDSAGELIGGQFASDWTADGFVVLDDIHASGPVLEIEGRRLLVTRLTPEFAFSAAKKKSADGKNTEPALLKIDVDFGKVAPSAEQADAAISRIFLTEQDSLAHLVPEYWKDCVLEGLASKDENCRFSSQIIAIPGVALPSESGQSLAQPHDLSQPHPTFRVGNGVRPPKVIFQPEPEFSEGARAAKYQGTATLGLIVSTDGKPTRIKILSPLGAGLDAQAVRAVESWKFEPARKDGQPVPVMIAVEVNFHLY